MKKLTTLLLLMISLVVLSSCESSDTQTPSNPTPEPNTPTVITLTFSAANSSNYTLEKVEGATDVATPGTDPELTLTIGTRYRIINRAFGVHPFALTSNETYLATNILLKEDGTGSFAGNADVKLEKNSDGITFTLTQELAAQMKSYLCTFHADMFGTVTVK